MILSDLILLTAKQSGYSTNDIISKSRVSALVVIRQRLIYQLRIETNYSLSEIGQALGGRSPATIAWGFRREAMKIESKRSAAKGK